MPDPASRSGSSVTCLSQSTAGTDAAMSDLEEDVLMGGQVVMVDESTGGAVKWCGRHSRFGNEPSPLSQLQLASPAWEADT